MMMPVASVVGTPKLEVKSSFDLAEAIMDNANCEAMGEAVYYINPETARIIEEEYKFQHSPNFRRSVVTRRFYGS